MPYIKQEDRTKFDADIKSLIGKLKEKYSPGELNYVISSIIWELFSSRYSYAAGNELMGVLECVKHEFYRRKLSPYECSKLLENGDL